MKKPIPNYNLKLSPAKLKESENLGTGADLRNMFAAFKLFGALGSKNNSQAYIASCLYDELPKKAAQRLDNKLRGSHSLIAEEINYFRECIAYIAGDNLAKTIHEDQIRLGKAQNLIRDVLMQAPSLKWQDRDPLNAIFSLAGDGRKLLGLSIHNKRMRNVKRAHTSTIEFPEFDDEPMKPGQKFYVHIQEYKGVPKLRYEPLVFNFSLARGTQSDGREYRGQFLYPAKEVKPSAVTSKDEKPEAHYWCSSDTRNRPWIIEPDIGTFGFLVLGNAGQCPEEYLPKGADPDCVSDEDLKFMYEKLAQSASMENDIIFGILNYDVR